MRYSVITVILSTLILCLSSPTFAQYSGSYDIGGGNNDFPSIVNAAIWLNSSGLSGPVICNIYNTTMWTGQVNISGAMPGLSAINTLTFQNAPGQSPVTQAPYYDGDGFDIFDGADYITIQGLEITGCEYAGIRITGLAGDSCSHIRILNNYIHDNGLYLDSGTGVSLWAATDCEIRGNYISGGTVGIRCSYSKRNLLANNMIYDLEAIMTTSHGIISSSCQNNAYYYNSIYDANVCVYTTDTYNLDMKNNIFYQPGGGTSYCLYFDTNTSLITSDYNDLYAPFAYVGYHYTYGNLISLTNWQTSAGLDANSISADPNFTNTGTGDLHITDPSPVGTAGIVIAEVTEDYDGDPRKPVNPDIGADEYLLPLAGSYDIGGGSNDYANIITAVQDAVNIGIGGAVIFYVYSGTYNGQVNLPAIPGTDAINTLAIQAATGQSPVVTNTTGTSQFDGNGFYFTGADYVTIQNLEITNCYADGIRNYFSGSDSSTHNSFIGNYIHNVGLFGDFSGISLYNGADCNVIGNEIDGDYYGINCSYGKRNLIANNMIYYNSNSGIYDYQGTNIQYYYNSVYLESSPGTTYNFYVYHGTNIETKNNIFYHSGVGTHYAYSIIGSLTSYPIVSDYNDLYAPDAHVGYYNGNRTTLVNWQTATGFDANSISADPNFVTLDTPDLHIDAPSPVDGVGTPTTEVGDDFDGEPRDAITPDIGADEFLAPLSGIYDVGGGANHFPSPQAAAQRLQLAGMSGPVTFNIFTGTYDGQVSLSAPVYGLSAVNTLTFQNAPGESPVISCTSSSTGRGFWIVSADYVTVQGLEITNCYRDGISFVGVASDSATNNRAIGNYIHNTGTGYSAIFAQRMVDCEIIGNEITDSYGGISCLRGRSNLIANNMVHGMRSTGLYEYVGLNDRFYYNSVYMDTLQALYIRQSTDPIVKNNILFQDGTGNSYAFYILSPVTIGVSDYNDLYAPNGYVGYYTAAQTTLSAWQTATGLDPHSISANPNFMSISAPYDLHISEPSPCDSTATPIAGITTDFDGDPRDPIAPDIGADEIGATGPPGVVDDLIITLSNSTDDSTNITLIWSPALNAQQYHIYKSSDPYIGFTLIGSTPDTTYTDTNAIIGQPKSFYHVTTDNEP